jgi:hypothetical protein
MPFRLVKGSLINSLRAGDPLAKIARRVSKRVPFDTGGSFNFCDLICATFLSFRIQCEAGYCCSPEGNLSHFTYCPSNGSPMIDQANFGMDAPSTTALAGATHGSDSSGGWFLFPPGEKHWNGATPTTALRKPKRRVSQRFLVKQQFSRARDVICSRRSSEREIRAITNLEIPRDS